jgi:tetrahydromethanopterin S-methyltransferase subunit G
MFVDDTPTITEKRAEIRELNDRLTALEKGPPLPPWQMSEAEFVREFEALRERTEKAEKTLDFFWGNELRVFRAFGGAQHMDAT